MKQQGWGGVARDCATALGMSWLASTLAARVLPGEDLEPWEVAAPGTAYQEVSGMPVAYHDIGVGEHTILLLPGFDGSIAHWHPLQQGLAGGYRSVAMDLWGFGASARPPSLRVEDWTPQCLGLLDALGIERAVIAGLSLGGRVALSCAAMHPDRVRGIVLFGCDGFHMPYLPLVHLLARTAVPQVIMRWMRRHRLGLEMLMRLSYGQRSPFPDEVIRAFQRPMRVFGTERAWRHLITTYSNDDMPAILSRVQCPVLIIQGTDDRMVTAVQAMRMALTLSRVDVVLIPHGYHMLPVQCPEAMSSILHAYLVGLAP